MRPITPQRMVLACAFILLNLFLVPTLAAGQYDGSEVGVYSFNGSGGGPSLPYAGLITDSAGHLYGTTEFGGTYNHGTVFEVIANANGKWTESVLYSFTGGQDGGQPSGGLTFDAAGNLYGTTNFGGSANCKLGCGTIFKLTHGSGYWAETVVYTFTGGSDGREPYAGLVSDGQGNFYGTTLLGGNLDTVCSSGCGTVFKMSQSNGTWVESVLYAFAGGNDGAMPYAGLTFDGANNLYGATNGGGPYGSGTVFRLTAGQSGSWTESVLHAFTGGQDGSYPTGNLILDTAGNLYGTASKGGVKGYGVVFKLSPTSGGTWQELVLHTFWNSPAANPAAGLVMDAAGNLYGTTLLGADLHSCGGGCGTLFKLSRSSSGSWTFGVHYLFGRATDGYHPSGQLIRDAAGNLYGTTQAGGAYGAGVVFEISMNAKNGVKITTASLPNGTVGSAYSTTLTASGGTLPYSWTVTSGALPAGLSLSNGGTITGTPTSAGQSNFTVQVTDSSSPVQKATKPFSISISVNALPLTITTSSLPSGTVGSGYSTSLTATGGTTPYSWTVTLGALPAGLSLSQGGMISGTPTSAGQSNFTVQVTDSSSPIQKATKPLSISISSTGASLTITSASLPNGIVGTAYSSTLTATGGTLPYSWTVTSGALPEGLSLSQGGTISGTPTSAGASNFTVQVTDSSSPVQKVSKAFDPTVISKLTITGTIKPNAVSGQAYSSTDTASGGIPAYTWSVSSGTLPPGLELAATTGTISGTPNQDGTYNFTLKVVDSGSPEQSATQPDKITVVTGAKSWSLQTTQVGWQFVAPDNGVTCKYVSLSGVDDGGFQSAGTNCPTYGAGTNCDTQLLNKYGGDWGTWANEQSARLSDLGFTAAGTFSYRYGSHKGPSTLPVATVNNTSAYAMGEDNSHSGTQYYVKNAAQVISPGSMVCGGSIYQGSEMDPFDPTAQAAMNSEMSYWVSGSGAWNGSSAIIAVPEDGDDQFLTDQRAFHVDGGLLILINNPMNKTSRWGHGYSDATNYAKQALSSWLKRSTEVSQPLIPLGAQATRLF